MQQAMQTAAQASAQRHHSRSAQGEALSCLPTRLSICPNLVALGQGHLVLGCNLGSWEAHLGIPLSFPLASSQTGAQDPLIVAPLLPKALHQTGLRTIPLLGLVLLVPGLLPHPQACVLPPRECLRME